MILVGLVSNIVASYLSTLTLWGYSVEVISIPVLIVLIIVSASLILYPKEIAKTRIYTNLMVDRNNKRMYFSPYSPLSVRAVE